MTDNDETAIDTWVLLVAGRLDVQGPPPQPGGHAVQHPQGQQRWGRRWRWKDEQRATWRPNRSGLVARWSGQWQLHVCHIAGLDLRQGTTSSALENVPSDYTLTDFSLNLLCLCSVSVWSPKLPPPRAMLQVRSTEVVRG